MGLRMGLMVLSALPLTLGNLLAIIVPMVAFIGAGRAKKGLDLAGWKRWHALWHLSGSLLCWFYTHRLGQLP